MMEMQPADIIFLQEQIAFNRDERSYKRLFFYFYKPLFRFALSFLPAEAAEEIVSDVLMKIWSMNEGLAGINNLKLYLYRAIRNGAINYLSKNSRHNTWDIESI